MAYEIVHSSDAKSDMDDVLNHLHESYLSFGYTDDEAFERVSARTRKIYADIDILINNPFRGTLHDNLLTGLRHVTIDKAILWFTVDKSKKQVDILGIFYGGQDHIRHMIERLET